MPYRQRPWAGSMLRGLAIGPGPMPLHRRGADRELARALGAIRSPILLAPTEHQATASDTRASAARTPSPARMIVRGDRVSARAPAPGKSFQRRRAHDNGSDRDCSE